MYSIYVDVGIVCIIVRFHHVPQKLICTYLHIYEYIPQKLHDVRAV